MMGLFPRAFMLLFVVVTACLCASTAFVVPTTTLQPHYIEVASASSRRDLLHHSTKTPLFAFASRAQKGSKAVSSSNLVDTSSGTSGVVESITGAITSIPTKAKELFAAIEQRAPPCPIPVSKLALWTVCLSGIIILKRAAVPTGRFLHRKWFESWRSKLLKDESSGGSGGDYDDTVAYTVAEHVQTVGKIGTYLYSFHVLFAALKELFDVAILPEGFMVQVSKAVYTVWGATRIHKYKKIGIGKLLGKDPDKLGKAGIYDRIADVLLFALTLSTLAGIFSIDLGPGATTVLGVAALGTTVMAFASQDIAAQVIAGLSLVSSNKFDEGDTIKVGDEITGVVSKIGWLETEIREANEVVTKLPNSAFSKEQLTNLSRNNSCRVEEKLAFSYDDMSKIPTLVNDIKSKLKEKCPELISDGSRPFVVSWSGFGSDHLEVLVDARFNNIPPTGEEYYANKQLVMEAIAEAVVENDVSFAKATAPAAPAPPIQDPVTKAPEPPAAPVISMEEPTPASAGEQPPLNDSVDGAAAHME